MIKLSDLDLSPTSPSEMRESEIEKKCVKIAKRQGYTSYKFVSPGHRSVPDRIFMREAGEIFFVEFKRQGGKPTPKQKEEIEKIRKLGFTVWVCDSVEDFETKLEDYQCF